MNKCLPPYTHKHTHTFTCIHFTYIYIYVYICIYIYIYIDEKMTYNMADANPVLLMKMHYASCNNYIHPPFPAV